jgi:hypothetical protein
MAPPPPQAAPVSGNPCGTFGSVQQPPPAARVALEAPEGATLAHAVTERTSSNTAKAAAANLSSPADRDRVTKLLAPNCGADREAFINAVVDRCGISMNSSDMARMLLSHASVYKQPHPLYFASKTSRRGRTRVKRRSRDGHPGQGDAVPRYRDPEQDDANPRLRDPDPTTPMYLIRSNAADWLTDGRENSPFVSPDPAYTAPLRLAQDEGSRRSPRLC